MHSFITSLDESIICAPTRPVGRYYFTLQMAITKQEIKRPSCAYRGTLCLQRNFVPEPVFKCSLLACCLQGLIAFEAVQLQALWPQAILAASRKTSSIHNKYGMGGGQWLHWYAGAGMSNPKKTDMRNDWVSVTLNNWNQISSSKKVHNLHKSNLPIWNPWLSLKQS